MSATSFKSWICSVAPGWEQEAPDPVETPALRGSLEFLSLFDVIQWVCGSRRSWAIRVCDEGIEALVTVVDGDLTDARCGDKVGKEALLDILTLNRGHFELQPIVGETERTIEGNWTLALLSAARAAEERAASIGPKGPVKTTSESPPALPQHAGESDDTLEVIIRGTPSGPVMPLVDRDSSRSLASASPSHPDLSKTHDLVDQGFAAMRSGDIERAKLIWQQALERDPENRALRFNLRKLETLSETGG